MYLVEGFEKWLIIQIPSLSRQPASVKIFIQESPLSRQILPQKF